MKNTILLIVMLTLVAFVSGVMAQQKPATEKPATAPAPASTPAATEKVKLENFSGTVEKVDEMAKAIDVKGKVKKESKTLTFATDDKTKITKAGKNMLFADLKQGVRVSVSYKKDGDKMIAASIKVAAPKAAPKK
jgi:uncharacterized alpha/beta hydrolase family protein